MKKIFICFVAFALISLVFTGCSRSQDSGQPPVSVKTKDGSATVESGTGSLSVATGKSVALPKGYPKDIFPVYEGSFISMVTELEGSYVISAFSKDEVKKVIAFYEKVLEGAKVNMDTKTDESLTSMGTKSGYAYTMDVGKSPEKGYQTIITISLQPAE